MLTYSLDFFINKIISDLHHFRKWKFLWSILQVAVSVGTMQLTFPYQLCRCQCLLQLCRFWVSIAIMSVVFIQKKVFAANMWVFIEIMQVEVSVAIMQVIFSVVYYAHDYFFCNYAGGCFSCSYVCDIFQ